MLYLLAAWTGYRKGEIGSLTSASFDLTSDPAIVTVAAGYSKRRRRDQQVLHPYVAAKLIDWLAAKSAESETILFPISRRSGSSERDTAKMMERDLERARAQWLSEFPDSEQAKHAKSDYLCYKDREGRFADFHANRHTFITNLARAGVSPKTAQELARHSDIRLTLGLYTHTNLDDRAAAVRRLPSPQSKPARKEAAESNGVTDKRALTDETEKCQHLGSAQEAQDGKTGQVESPAGPETISAVVSRTTPQVLEESALGTTSRHPAGRDKNEAVGARTQDLRIKSPLLYRLSYSLVLIAGRKIRACENRGAFEKALKCCVQKFSRKGPGIPGPGRGR